VLLGSFCRVPRAIEEGSTMTDATRTRFSVTGEFLVAAAFLGATVLIGALVVRELRVAPRAFAASDQSPATSESVPPDAVSVPALMLGEANQIHVGDPVDAAVARLGPGVKLVGRSLTQGLLGPREIRSYDLSGTKFILVLEPFERRGEPRVAAIYLQ
jgi:hypothetical protein